MLKDCPRTDPPCQATKPVRMSRTAAAPAPSQMVRIVFPRICITNLLLGKGKKEEGKGKRENPPYSALERNRSHHSTSPHQVISHLPSSIFPLPSSLFIGCWSGAAIHRRATSR